MAEELKNLIEKIQEEGVKAAEDKAKTIELEAKRRAEEIIEKAENRAREILAKAREEIARMEAGGKASLKQAARDILLTLKKEISATLDKVVALNVRKALEPSQLIKIISALIKESVSKGTADIIIVLNTEQLEEIEKGLLTELGKEVVEAKITLKSSEDVRAGFTISYDAGKSYFDFTDASLSEYLASYLKPKLGNLLKES